MRVGRVRAGCSSPRPSAAALLRDPPTPFSHQRLRLCHSQTMDTGERQPSSPPPPRQKRPFCARCSKPAAVCLCSRLASPPLDNPIGVTILQHTLEAKHALNSTRVASLGLRHLAVVPVTDVLFSARYALRPLGAPAGGEADLGRISNATALRGGVPGTMAIETHFSVGDGDDVDDNDDNAVVNSALYKVICSSIELWVSLERTAKPDLSWVLGKPLGRAITSNGFIVKKLQRRQVKGSLELEDFEEFELVIPPGSALLFPGKSSIEVGAVDFEVKHLVVLDGTWDKAKRMYCENPWLQFLPHLKLELEGESLYSEVRHQPRAGCFSTIESIVYALRALGNDMEGLDNLLDVFKSMIGDQRRCKDEKFSRMMRS